MLDWKSYLISLLVLGVLALLLRWAFSGRATSVVERRPTAGHADEYGLLVAISSPSTFIDGEVLRQRLVGEGIRASLVSTSDGPRLMVFPDDETTARRILAR